MAQHLIIGRLDGGHFVEWLSVNDRGNRLGFKAARQALQDLDAKATRVAMDAMNDVFMNHLSDTQMIVLEDDPRATGDALMDAVS